MVQKSHGELERIKKLCGAIAIEWERLSEDYYFEKRIKEFKKFTVKFSLEVTMLISFLSFGLIFYNYYCYGLSIILLIMFVYNICWTMVQDYLRYKNKLSDKFLGYWLVSSWLLYLSLMFFTFLDDKYMVILICVCALLSLLIYIVVFYHTKDKDDES